MIYCLPTDIMGNTGSRKAGKQEVRLWSERKKSDGRNRMMITGRSLHRQ